MIDYLRLALATLVVLLPGRLVARALGQRLFSATLAWALGCTFVAWSVVFIVHGAIWLAAVVMAVPAVGALSARRLRARRSSRERGFASWQPGSADDRPREPFRGLVLAGGIVLGALLWHVEGAVVGDGLFHEARVRKLVDLAGLHLRTVDEFKDGGLHPGYAFPLWHGFLALISWVSGLDPATVMRHEPSLLAPLACLVAFEAGAIVFRSAWGGLSVLAAQLALFCFAAGHGGAFAGLTLPGTAARQLLAPAAIALFFRVFERLDWRPVATLAVAFGALALTHPTYAVFLLLPLLGFAVLHPLEWRRAGAALATAVVPTALALLWLRPLVDETVSHNPGPAERLRALHHYGSQLVIGNEHHYRLAAPVFGRSGAIAVAALLLLPVAAPALRRPWGAFVLGATLLILILLEVPWLFVHFSNAVSLSQSRRAAGFVPFAFVLAGALALLARRPVVLPLAFVAGIVLQRLWPGDFAYGLRHGGPAAATWIALAGGAAALVATVVSRLGPPREQFATGFVATALLTLPVVVHGFWHWSPRNPSDPGRLSPALVHALRTQVPKRAVVLAAPEVAYRAVAAAPVYAVALPVTHVADTKANTPYARFRAAHEWLRTGDIAPVRRYKPTWAIRDGRLYRLPQ